MKGLRKYLSPFAPDQSGAVSSLYEMGALIVIIDAGGCVGNICGYDEPRWHQYRKSAICSATLRDLDAILGRDKLLIDKIGDTMNMVDCNFIALIGTPIPAVIGTDLRALKRIIEKKYHIPVLAIDTNGMELYDKGQTKASLALLKEFCLKQTEEEPHTFPDLTIVGASALDLPCIESREKLCNFLRQEGLTTSYLEDSLETVRAAKNAKAILVVSPSGLPVAKKLQQLYHIPYICRYPLTQEDYTELSQSLHQLIGKEKEGKKANDETLLTRAQINPPFADKKVLIVHQSVIANALRNNLYQAQRVDLATWFTSIPKEEGANGENYTLKEEDDLLALCQKEAYDIVIGDPLLKRALPHWNGVFFPLPHFAISGELNQIDTEEDFLKGLYHA